MEAAEAEIDRLRSSNAILIAENEALKKRPLRQSLDAYVADHKNNGLIIADLEAKLSLYTSWQPSDPGTKEAMVCAEADAHPEGIAECSHWYDGCLCYVNASVVLAHALRAAMVRLEEAEKVIAGFQSGDIQ
jgi:hypothetical protein